MKNLRLHSRFPTDGNTSMMANVCLIFVITLNGDYLLMLFWKLNYYFQVPEWARNKGGQWGMYQNPLFVESYVDDIWWKTFYSHMFMMASLTGLITFATLPPPYSIMKFIIFMLIYRKDLTYLWSCSRLLLLSMSSLKKGEQSMALKKTSSTW